MNPPDVPPTLLVRLADVKTLVLQAMFTAEQNTSCNAADRAAATAEMDFVEATLDEAIQVIADAGRGGTT